MLPAALKRPLAQGVGVALAGALAVLGFAPFQIFFLPLLSLACLVAAWRRATPRGAALLGLAWGLGFFLAGVSWVYVSMHDVGGMDAPLAALATFLFCGVLALFYALAGFAFARWRRHDARDALLFAALWTLADWLRGVLFTGFPWLALGYAQGPPSPLAGFAPLLGVYGLSFITAGLAALFVCTQRRMMMALVFAVMIGGGYLLQRIEWTQPVGAPLSVALLQGNIPQGLKWDPQRQQLSLATYADLAARQTAALTVLPETALPMFFDQAPQALIAQLTWQGAALVGAVTRAQGAHRNYYNSAILLDGRSAQTYAKRHLVPYGEFAPPGFGWFFALVNIPMANFSAGDARQAPLTLGGQKIAPNICYEDVFGAEIIEALPAATLLVNLSNTAWFGHSLAQPQHLQIAQMRALETGRPVLRATNTGISALINFDGTVAAQLPPFTRGVLNVVVTGRAGATPFVRWGNGAALLLAALAALIAVFSARIPQRQGR